MKSKKAKKKKQKNHKIIKHSIKRQIILKEFSILIKKRKKNLKETKLEKKKVQTKRVLLVL